MKLRSLVGMGLLLLAVSVCDSEVEEGDSPSSIALEDLPAKIAAVFCGAFEDCVGSGFEQLVIAGEDCTQLYSKQLGNGTLPLWQKAVDDGTAVYHADKAQACLDSLAALGCEVLTNAHTDECEAALEGTVAEGGACNHDVGCSGDRFCDTEAGCPGICVARLASGSICQNDDNCQSGMMCDDGHCAAPKKAGEPCGGVAGGDCMPGMVCVGEGNGTAGMCKTFGQMFSAAVGESCDIEESWCQLGAHCAGTDFTPPDTFTAECMATAPSGGACYPAIPDMCPAGEYCDADLQSGSLEGSCKPLPKAGAPCASGYGKQCEHYHRCENEVCRAMQENGGPCQEDSTCYSDSCNGGTCGTDDHCAS